MNYLKAFTARYLFSCAVCSVDFLGKALEFILQKNLQIILSDALYIFVQFIYYNMKYFLKGCMAE